MAPIRTSPSLKQNSEKKNTLTSPGWSKEQKSALFHHVISKGETAWGGAVAGKTGHQVSGRLSSGDSFN